MPTEQQVTDSVRGLINAALPASVRCYEPDKVPSTRPAEYLVLTVVRRSGGTPRSGRYVTSGWSAYVMAASQTATANARNSLEKARGALESVAITVDGVASTPIRFDNARPVAPDDGWFSGVNIYTFAL